MHTDTLDPRPAPLPPNTPPAIRIEHDMLFDARYGTAVLSAHDGHIFQGATFSGTPIASYDDEAVYAGRTTLGSPVARLKDGRLYRADDPDGAPVAIVGDDATSAALLAAFHLILDTEPRRDD
ncbi:MAG: hypothetical protein H6704_28480 [Myxococcales bacterium]|nr:hypothetical protein [Myxococcales bacterium]